MVTGGPMLSGRWNGEPLGSGTDGRRLFEQVRAGRIGEEQWAEVEGCISRSAGHCTVMGNRVHDGVDGRGPGHDAARWRRHPPRSMRGATNSPKQAGAGSSPWCQKI